CIDLFREPPLKRRRIRAGQLGTQSPVFSGRGNSFA
ncbi:hypothetical protein CARUB_v10011798mg, partial [Capsella rubella]